MLVVVGVCCFCGVGVDSCVRVVFLKASSTMRSCGEGRPTVVLGTFNRAVLFSYNRKARERLVFTGMDPVGVSGVFLDRCRKSRVLNLPKLLRSVGFEKERAGLAVCKPGNLGTLGGTVFGLKCYGVSFPVRFVRVNARAVRDYRRCIVGSRGIGRRIPYLTCAIRRLGGPEFLHRGTVRLKIPINPTFKGLRGNRRIRIGNGVVGPRRILNPTEGKGGMACSNSAAPYRRVVRFTRSSAILVRRSACLGRSTSGTTRGFRSASRSTTEVTGRDGSGRLVLARFDAECAVLSSLLGRTGRVFRGAGLTGSFVGVRV